MDKLYVRVNGRGNAWPVQLGKTHPFYNRNRFEDLSNASFSILSENNGKINWSVLIDGGHGAIQYLIRNENRIPEAIFITHPHHDHIYSMDWVIQSYYRQNRKKYPVYASKECFLIVLKIFPHLEGMVDFKALDYYEKTDIYEIPGLKCTAFPVFHGLSAKGACMLMFEIQGCKMLFSGDVLCPLLDEDDYLALKNVNVFFADCNNRFPLPLSNHWSVVSTGSDLREKSRFLVNFVNELDEKVYENTHFLKRTIDIKQQCFSIVDFVKHIEPKSVQMVHYSGNEDLVNYSERIMTADQLRNWLVKVKKNYHLESGLSVPDVGEKIFLGII